MSWKCHCELCHRAFQGKIETHRWVDFLRHRKHAVLELEHDEKPRRVYLAEVEGDVLMTTERMEGYKTLAETWGEEVRLTGYVAGCEVEIYEDGGTPFDKIMRERVVA